MVFRETGLSGVCNSLANFDKTTSTTAAICARHPPHRLSEWRVAADNRNYSIRARASGYLWACVRLPPDRAPRAAAGYTCRSGRAALSSTHTTRQPDSRANVPTLRPCLLWRATVRRRCPIPSSRRALSASRVGPRCSAGRRARPFCRRCRPAPAAHALRCDTVCIQMCLAVFTAARVFAWCPCLWSLVVPYFPKPPFRINELSGLLRIAPQCSGGCQPASCNTIAKHLELVGANFGHICCHGRHFAALADTGLKGLKRRRF
jgi:hypothetical protein